MSDEMPPLPEGFVLSSNPPPLPKGFKIVSDDAQEGARKPLPPIPEDQTVPKFDKGKKAPPALPEGVSTVNVLGVKTTLHDDLMDPFMRASWKKYQATGKPIKPDSFFRTYEEQKEIRERHEKMPGGVKAHPAAEPGKSLHNKGRAFDDPDWKEDEPYLKAEGFVNTIPNDPGHFFLKADDPYTTGKVAYRKAAPYLKPAAEFAGTAGGATAGAASGLMTGPGAVVASPVGALAGSGLGYAFVRQGERALDEWAGLSEPVNNVKAITQAGMDVLHGAVMEGTGQVAGKYFLEPVAAWAGGKLANVGKGIYEAGLKASKKLRVEGIDRAVTTGIEGKYWLTDKGLEKLKADRQDLAQKLGKIVDKMTAKGAEVDTVAIAADVQKLKDGYKGIDAEKAHAAIDERITALWERVGERGRISAKEAHEIKQGIYKDLGEKAYGEMAAAAKEADKQIARHINEQLKEVYPEYGRINQELSDKINLTKPLEDAVIRIRKHNKVSLADIISVSSALGGGTAHGGPAEGAAMALATYITKHVLDSPAVKSRLAYALAKSAKITGKSLGKPFGYTAGKIEEASEPVAP